MSINVGKGWMECFCVTIRSIDLGPGTFSFGIIAVFTKMDNIIKRLYAGLLICLDLNSWYDKNNVPFLASPVGILLGVTR